MKIVIHPDFMQTADFIKQLPQHFAQEGELLYEGRNEVRRYRVKNEWLVVKKYKQPNIIQRIVYTFFKKSKTERAYLFAGMLRKPRGSKASLRSPAKAPWCGPAISSRRSSTACFSA